MLNQTILCVPAETALPHSSHDNPQNGLSGTAPFFIIVETREPNVTGGNPFPVFQRFMGKVQGAIQFEDILDESAVIF
jgi:hypothetical protein